MAHLHHQRRCPVSLRARMTRRRKQPFGARRKAFRALHERGCFVIPNPWDVGSARTASAPGIPRPGHDERRVCVLTGACGFGGRRRRFRDRNLAYIADITAAVDLPVSADFMSGYGMKPEDVAESVTRCVATGVAGLSIEDATGDSSSPSTTCRSRPSASVPRDRRLINQARTCC